MVRSRRCALQSRFEAYGMETHTWVIRKVSVRFEYLENRLRVLYVTWQPVRGDLTARQ